MKKIVFIFIILSTLLIASCAIVTTDTDNYLEIEHSALPEFLVFPPELNNSKEVNEYFHADHKYSDGIEIYLSVHYDEKEFMDEINRIEQITYAMHSTHTPKGVVKDDGQLFNYTTYITVYNQNGVFEYACVDVENRNIVYIALYAMTYDGISFDKKYLPKDYEEIKLNNNVSNYHYNMYNTHPWDQ